MNLEPVLSQFSVEDLEDSNMAAIHRNGLPRFRENENNDDFYADMPPLLEDDASDDSDDSTVILDGDDLQAEDMGEWLADAEADVEKLSTQDKKIKGVEAVAVDITHVEQVDRRALVELNVAKLAKKKKRMIIAVPKSAQ